MDPTQDNFDAFNRLLTYIDVPAAARGPEWPAYDLNRAMIQTGYSRAYTFERRVRRYDSYRAAEDEARTAGRGVWSQCGGDFHL